MTDEVTDEGVAVVVSSSMGEETTTSFTPPGAALAVQCSGRSARSTCMHSAPREQPTTTRQIHQRRRRRRRRRRRVRCCTRPVVMYTRLCGTLSNPPGRHARRTYARTLSSPTTSPPRTRRTRSSPSRAGCARRRTAHRRRGVVRPLPASQSAQPLRPRSPWYRAQCACVLRN